MYATSCGTSATQPRQGSPPSEEKKPQKQPLWQQEQRQEYRACLLNSRCPSQPIRTAELQLRVGLLHCAADPAVAAARSAAPAAATASHMLNFTKQTLFCCRAAGQNAAVADGPAASGSVAS